MLVAGDEYLVAVFCASGLLAALCILFLRPAAASSSSSSSSCPVIPIPIARYRPPPVWYHLDDERQLQSVTCPNNVALHFDPQTLNSKRLFFKARDGDILDFYVDQMHEYSSLVLFHASREGEELVLMPPWATCAETRKVLQWLVTPDDSELEEDPRLVHYFGIAKLMKMRHLLFSDWIELHTEWCLFARLFDSPHPLQEPELVGHDEENKDDKQVTLWAGATYPLALLQTIDLAAQRARQSAYKTFTRARGSIKPFFPPNSASWIPYSPPPPPPPVEQELYIAGHFLVDQQSAEPLLIVPPGFSSSWPSSYEIRMYPPQLLRVSDEARAFFLLSHIEVDSEAILYAVHQRRYYWLSRFVTAHQTRMNLVHGACWTRGMESGLLRAWRNYGMAVAMDTDSISHADDPRIVLHKPLPLARDDILTRLEYMYKFQTRN